MKKFRLISAWVGIFFSSSLQARDDERISKPPAVIDAAFVAPAHMRSYFLDVQAIEPRWLYEKQGEKGFPIKSYASEVAVVYDVPTPVGKEMKSHFAELAESSDKVKKDIANGPLLGPERAYIVFDSAKTPILIIYLQLGHLVTSHAHVVSENDTFQAFKGWTSYNQAPELVKFLTSLDPSEAYQTPFLKWSGESQGK